MTDVPRDDSGAVPPRPAEPGAFDDDALAAALEADIKSYTQPISIVPPAAAPTAAAPAAPATPQAAPAPPLTSPGYESEYEAPDVPEYVVPPAPPAPDFGVPPPPAPTAYEPPPAPAFDEPAFDEPGFEPVPEAPRFEAFPQPAAPQPQATPLFPLPEERPTAPQGPSTLDRIQRLEDEIRRQTGEVPVAQPSDPAPAPFAADPAPAPQFPWDADPEPADVAGTDPSLDGAWDLTPPPVEVAPPVETAPTVSAAPSFETEPPVELPPPPTPQAAAPPAAAPETPAAPQAPLLEQWAAAPPPVAAPPPPLVEPTAAFTAPPATTPAPEPTVPPTEGATYVAPTVLPPIREVRLEDVQGLPPPIGQQAAPLPPYDPNAPVIVTTGSAAPPSAAPSAPPASTLPPHAAPPLPSTDPGIPAFDELDRIDQAEGDDAVDDVDRIFGTPPAEGSGFAAAPAFPSEPIPTQRVTETQPGLVDQKPENHPVFVVENAGPEPTALDLRAGRAARLFWLWFATNSSVISLAIGAALFTVGVSLRQAIVAALAGVALSFLPLGLGTLAGKWSGQPTMVVSRATFGHVGNLLPAFVAVLTRVFWGAVLLWLLAFSAAELLVFAGLDAGMGVVVWTYVLLGVGVALTTVIALFGYGFVALLQLISSILSGLLVAGVIYMTWPMLNLDAALAVGDGAWTMVLGGAVLVFSFVGLAWVQSSGDLARYQRPSSSGAQSMLWAALGATLPPFALIAWGAMLAASDPAIAQGLTTSPLTTIARMLPLWYPAPLLAAAGLGLISSVVLAMYSGGFALQSLGIRARRSITTLIAAALVAILAAGLVVLDADAFVITRDLATTLAVPVAAWAGIFAAEMMIRTRRFDSASLLAPGGVYPQVRIVNLLGFVLITAIGYGFTTAVFPGLTWQGYLFAPLGIAAADPFALADVGVFIALLLGIILPLATAIPIIRNQERASLRAEHTGPIPRVTGAVPRATDAVRTPGAPASRLDG